MISVVIPSLKPGLMRPLLDSIEANIKGSYEVLVQTEQGYLKAVLAGFNKAKGDVVVIMDCDGSHNPVYFQGMFDLLKRADIVIGSRYVAGARSDDVLIRRLVSRFFCKCTRVLLGLREIADVMSGFIVIKRSVLDQLRIDSVGYKIGVSILMQANHRFAIAEYPIVFAKSRFGNYVKLRNIRDGLETIVFIGKLFVRRVL